LLALLDTGLRAAEFCSLRVGDLDMRSGLAIVTGKGSKQRTVRVGAKARGAIVKMLALTGQTLAVCTPCKLLVSKGVSPCDRFPHARGTGPMQAAAWRKAAGARSSRLLLDAHTALL